MVLVSVTESCVIIGLGQIGMGYDFDVTGNSNIYTHARAISLHNAFRLIGAVDVSPELRTRFEQRYCVPAFDKVESAVAQLRPDVVVIATPSGSYNAILIKVLDRFRPKLILCEKPLAYALDEAREVVETCEKNDIDLFVNYIRRSDPGAVTVKRLIESGVIRTPVKVNVWYSKGIINNGSHFINLLEYWLGEILSTRIINPGRMWSDRDPEPDVEIQFQLGNAIVRSVWEESFSHHSIELLSTSGRLLYEKGGRFVAWQTVQTDPNFNSHSILADQQEVIVTGMEIYQWHVYDEIAKYFKGLESKLCSGRQAFKTLESINLIIESRNFENT